MDDEEHITKFVSWPWCNKKERVALSVRDWNYFKHLALRKGLSLGDLYLEIYSSVSDIAADWSVQKCLVDFLNRQREKDRIAHLRLTPVNDNDEFQLWEPAERYFLSRSMEEILKGSQATYQLRRIIKFLKIIWLLRFIARPKYLVSE